jgi:hypothetical protein
MVLFLNAHYSLQDGRKPPPACRRVLGAGVTFSVALKELPLDRDAPHEGEVGRDDGDRVPGAGRADPRGTHLQVCRCAIRGPCRGER